MGLYTEEKANLKFAQLQTSQSAFNYGLKFNWKHNYPISTSFENFIITSSCGLQGNGKESYKPNIPGWVQGHFFCIKMRQFILTIYSEAS